MKKAKMSKRVKLILSRFKQLSEQSRTTTLMIHGFVAEEFDENFTMHTDYLHDEVFYTWKHKNEDYKGLTFFN
jgi:hypothetical protein